MSNSGISNDLIDTLYRGFFAHSTGFFNKIREVIESYSDLTVNTSATSVHKTKSSIISAIWRVYQILIEFAFKNNYNMQILELQD